MTAVGELVLVLGLLVSAHCEVRARDPEVEEEQEEVLGGRAGGGRGAFPPPHLMKLHPGTTETPPLGERARTGNWCAFVQTRVVTMAVACGTEKYTIRSQSPCPSGIPDCQLVMYKLSTRPVYTQKQKILTTLHWACCKGHGGHNCEDTVPDDSQLDSESSDLSGGFESEKQEFRAADVHVRLQHQHQHQQQQQQQQQQQGDLSREQNDHYSSVTQLYDASYPPNQHNTTGHTHHPDGASSLHPTSHHTANTYDHHHHRHHDEQQQRPDGDEVDATVDVLSYPGATVALPVPHMMALVMSQLQPVLQGFNRSLEHLSQQVGDLARDVALLKSKQQGLELQPRPLDGPELDEATEERLDSKLDEVFRQIGEVRKQMESQRTDMENRLHSQHAMLHYNFTSFKMDMDMKLKRHQKMLQVSLQAMNTTLSELMLDQDLSPEDQDLEDQDLEDHVPPPSSPPPLQPLLSDTSALWEAIERLDNVVVNNTVKVSGLMEDVEVTSGSVQQLKRGLKELEKLINQTARNSQIQFMETGLEVDEAKVTVLQRVSELAGNLTLQGVRLQEMDVDVDYLYTALYKNSSSGDCGCNALMVSVSQLERAVSNVTELANDNRLALDENSKGEAEQWGKASHLITTVEELQQGLQQVNASLVSEQSWTRSLNHSLTRLSGSVTVSLAEVSGLKDTNGKLKEEMQHLQSSFQSLLKDAIRHSDVLELLLGEEVLEFLAWPDQDQEAHSIPALKQQLRNHDLKIRSLQENRPGSREEEPSADQPSSSHRLLPDRLTRSDGVPARERQLLLLHPEPRRPQHRGDGSDLWNLEKMVEELGLKLLRLEEKPCQCPNISTERQAPPAGVDAKLQAEVLWLKRGLENHLSMFKNVFSNADVLVGSDATLELDKVWELVKSKDEKKEKKRRGEGGGGGGGGGHRRSRRDSAGVAPAAAGLAEDPLLFVAGSPVSVSSSDIVFKASVNRGQFHLHTGTFAAPVDGLYLFILTLDLRPGPVHVLLRRGSGGAPVSLHRATTGEAGPVTSVGLLLLREGEEVRLELREGAWMETEDNVFTGLLLHRTT